MIDNIAEGTIALGWVGCGLMVVGGLAFLAKMLVIDPLRHRRNDREELARLSPKAPSKVPATQKPKAVDRG